MRYQVNEDHRPGGGAPTVTLSYSSIDGRAMVMECSCGAKFALTERGRIKCDTCGHDFGYETDGTHLRMVE